MQKLIFIILLCLYGLLSSAQSPILRIRGQVVDSLTNAPLENTTLQLFQGANLLKSVQSRYDGTFIFNQIAAGNYQIKISYVGYKNRQISIDLTEKQQNLIVKLNLDQVDLTEVTIKAKKPLVSQQNGAITYQIEGSIWQNSGNAQSLINRIPVLKGRSGGSYLLYGAKVTFLLDGKPIDNNGQGIETILETLGAIDLEKIEIIQNPAPNLARYGRPLVNIKTLKMKDNGTLYSLTHGYGRGINDRFNNGLKFNLKKEQLAFGYSLYTIPYYTAKQLWQCKNVPRSKIYR